MIYVHYVDPPSSQDEELSRRCERVWTVTNMSGWIIDHSVRVGSALKVLVSGRQINSRSPC